VLAAVSSQVWLAVERSRLADRNARRPHYAEALRRVSAEATLSPHMPTIVEQLAPMVRELAGAELLDVQISDRQAARLFSAAAPRGETAAQVRRWRRRVHRASVEIGGVLAVPLLLDDGVVGVLRARALPDRPPEDTTEFLSTLASSLAELVSRTFLQARVIESERGLAVADERQRMAQELHDNVGRLLVLAGASVDQAVAATTQPAQRARLREASELLGQAAGRVRSSAQAIDVLTPPTTGLPDAVRRIVRDLSATGVSAHLRIEDTPRAVSAEIETLVLRAAVMALGTLQRPGRAAMVWATLRYRDDIVAVDVVDDGIALASRAERDGRVHTELRVLRDRLDAVEGSCVVQPYVPRGLHVVCSVPLPARPSRRGPRVVVPSTQTPRRSG
jgi:signal transduction histidine kinase